MSFSRKIVQPTRDIPLGTTQFGPLRVQRAALFRRPTGTAGMAVGLSIGRIEAKRHAPPRAIGFNGENRRQRIPRSS